MKCKYCNIDMTELDGFIECSNCGYCLPAKSKKVK